MFSTFTHCTNPVNRGCTASQDIIPHKPDTAPVCQTTRFLIGPNVISLQKTANSGTLFQTTFIPGISDQNTTDYHLKMYANGCFWLADRPRNDLEYAETKKKACSAQCLFPEISWEEQRIPSLGHDPR
jgi:hypothetical protein